ncbi:MAG: tripartite tricarboxylate transporter substrate binding protein [Rhizobiales bacterium]|nr:tripartite tricarboxylate transporter substrate binding protein [Hyphomicrobiales bacterium]
MKISIGYATAIAGAAVLTVIVTSGFSPARTQTASFPTRTITIIVPFPAGGTADMLPRVVAERLRVTFGQPVVIENKPGASGNLGAEQVFRATPDGYTLLNAPQLSYSINHLLNPNLSFDPRGFEPVSVLATYPTVLFARADLPANNLAELLAYARANPGKLTYASQGKGQIAHLTMEALKMMAKVDILHIPYRGSAPALNNLLGGHVDVLPDNLLAGLQHVQNGKLKIIGVGGHERMPGLPDIATFAEVVPGLYSETWMAISAPPGTPKEITGKLSAAIAEAIKVPETNQRFRDLGAMPFGSTPDQMRDLIKQSMDLWAPVVTSAKITSE